MLHMYSEVCLKQPCEPGPHWKEREVYMQVIVA